MRNQRFANILIVFMLLNSIIPKITLAQEKINLDSAYMNIELGEVLITSFVDREVLTSKEIMEQHEAETSKALRLLPGMLMSDVGQRNEGTVLLRGFDLRSVPVFFDGIPVYVPYDGYVDLNRFMTTDLSKIEVAKGFASIIYGPNTLGGAINLISRKPQNPFEFETRVGWFSGNGMEAMLSIGGKDRFYFQWDVSNFQKEHIDLPSSFNPSALEMDFKLDNSHRKDQKVRIKVGFTPGSEQEYSINYSFQHGEKGTPVYLGDDPNIRVRYWSWPYWNKQSLYFLGNSGLGSRGNFKSRLYINHFSNRLESYDDASYDSQNAKYAFSSLYNDLVYGAKFEWSNNLFNKHQLTSTFQLKNDLHQERNIDEPERQFIDQTYTLGIEDHFMLFNGIRLVPGIAYLYRLGLKAEDFNSNSGLITDLPLKSDDAFNMQIASYWKVAPHVNMSLIFARKSRFATMNDRYSYKLGRAIPNPDLEAELVYNSEFTIDWKINKSINFKQEFFISNLYHTIQLVDEVKPGISQMQNTGESLFYGVDAILNSRFNEWLDFAASYSYIKRQNLSNPELLFINAPDHKAIINLGIIPSQVLRLNILAEYNSVRNSTSYGTKAASFVLVNSNISTNIFKNTTIRFGVNNLIDAYYERTEGYPGEGRNYYIAVQFQISKSKEKQ